MEQLSCENIKLGYGGHCVVDGLSFSLMDGDYLCIVGENGSGKSTLVKGILGLMKPMDGEIIFNGVRQNEIGYMPQQTDIQKDFPASVFEVVLSGCLNKLAVWPFYSKKEKERASRTIESVGMESFIKKSYQDLSGGQRQRVLLARALCSTEKLLLLDEPTAGLDPIMTGELYDLIDLLNHEQGVSVIMVSHDIKSAVKYGKKILHMHRQSPFFGSVGEYLDTDFYSKMIGGGENV